MRKTLHLFRHGQTDWNTQGRLQGHTDIPLNDEGKKQALRLQDYFQTHNVEAFISSDLLRALETAQIANALIAKPLLTTADLRESSMGDLEGLTRVEAHLKYGKESWEKWTSVDPKHHDFAFPRAESSREAIARILNTLTRFCQETDFSEIGVCTHGLVIRRFLHHLKPSMPEVLPVPNCSVHKIQWDPVQKIFLF